MSSIQKALPVMLKKGETKGSWVVPTTPEVFTLDPKAEWLHVSVPRFIVVSLNNGRFEHTLDFARSSNPGAALVRFVESSAVGAGNAGTSKVKGTDDAAASAKNVWGVKYLLDVFTGATKARTTLDPIIAECWAILAETEHHAAVSAIPKGKRNALTLKDLTGQATLDQLKAMAATRIDARKRESGKLKLTLSGVGAPSEIPDTE